MVAVLIIKYLNIYIYIYAFLYLIQIWLWCSSFNIQCTCMCMLRADTNVVKVNDWGDVYPNLVVVFIHCMFTLTCLPQVALNIDYVLVSNLTSNLTK